MYSRIVLCCLIHWLASQYCNDKCRLVKRHTIDCPDPMSDCHLTDWFSDPPDVSTRRSRQSGVEPVATGVGGWSKLHVTIFSLLFPIFSFGFFFKLCTTVQIRRKEQSKIDSNNKVMCNNQTKISNNWFLNDNIVCSNELISQGKYAAQH